jgi:glycosyltransferase involved in cell wall biosynthesis
LRREIRSFSPDAVLYVPTTPVATGSFVRTSLLRRHAPRAAHGTVALIPPRHRAAAGPLLRATAPDVLFVLSYRSLLHARQMSLNSEFISAAVDAGAYRPPTAGERDSAREKIGVERGSYVFLHVGRIEPGRNLERLTTLAATPGSSAVAVAVGQPGDRQLRSRLDRAGVRVVPDPASVEPYFRAADCYVFPVDAHGEEVEQPLAVFEALASGVPVITTPFGGLRDHLPPGDDLFYIESDDELLAAAAQLRQRRAPEVRSMVDFSWDRVARCIAGALVR